MENEHHLHVLQDIDRTLEEVKEITVPQGIAAAVEAGRMTKKEGRECLAAYERSLRPNGDDAA